MITDHDIHQDPTILAPCHLLYSGSHPEYISAEIRQALDDFIHSGKSYFYMGGNGFYWSCAFNYPRIEVRRGGIGCRTTELHPEERQHTDGSQGGLWSEIRGNLPLTTCGLQSNAAGMSPGVGLLIAPNARCDPETFFLFVGVDRSAQMIGTTGEHSRPMSGDEFDSYRPQSGIKAYIIASSIPNSHGPDYHAMLDTLKFPAPDTRSYIRQDMVLVVRSRTSICLGMGAIDAVTSLTTHSIPMLI